MKDNQNLNRRAFSGVMWKFSEQAGVQLAQLVTNITLARILEPEDFGTIGILTIFMAVSDVFIQQGFTTALIQKKGTSELDYSSVFYANMGLAAVIYGILYVSAPWISDFYGEQQLTKMLRILSISTVIGSFSTVQLAILSKTLDFRKSFFRGLSSTLAHGAVGIVLARSGFGVWSLVYSRIAGVLVGSIVLWVSVKWHPKAMFSVNSIRSLFGYSSRILGTRLLDTIFNNIHSVFIGKFFTISDLGYYQKGQQIPQMIMVASDGSINQVLYPTLSILQDDLVSLKNALRRALKTSMFITLPVMFGLIAVAEPLITILFTDKWLPSVPFMQLACVICAFWPLSSTINALNAIGLSNVTLKLSLLTKVITLLFLAVSISFGIYAIMVSTILTSFVTTWITSYYVNMHIRYSIKELLLDILPPVALSIVMMVIVFLVGRVVVDIYTKVILQIITGATVYVTGAFMLRIDSLNYLVQLMRKR